MTLRDDVLGTLGVAPDGYDDVAGHQVPRAALPVRPWTGELPNTQADDCEKERSVLQSADGAISCIEVEVVRILRSRWDAGWVQGWPCGRRSWDHYIWKTLPEPVNELNARVQEARGKSRVTTFSGHPDVAVVDGHRVVYIECKMMDRLKVSQVEWFTEALTHGIVRLSQLAVVKGVLAGGRQ